MEPFVQKDTDNTETVKKSAFMDRYEWAETLITTAVAVILLLSFVVQTNVVFGSSMVPTLEDKNVLLISRIGMKPAAGDIVVITKPIENQHSLIKRVIATEGQTVNIDFETNTVYVDGEALSEPYINAPTKRQFDVVFPVTVPEGCVFVMGDNRNDSLDSRHSDVGMIDTRYILGRVLLRVAPFDDFGSV